MDNRHVWTKREKKLIGLCCCNCGSLNDVEYHHIVPLALGGTDSITNMCCLCYSCHLKLHGMKKKNPLVSRSEAVKAGMEKAKARGVQIGSKKGSRWISKNEAPAKAIILQYNRGFGGKLTNEETMELAGISKNCFYKYKKELKEQLEKQQT